LWRPFIVVTDLNAAGLLDFETDNTDRPNTITKLYKQF